MFKKPALVIVFSSINEDSYELAIRRGASSTSTCGVKARQGAVVQTGYVTQTAFYLEPEYLVMAASIYLLLNAQAVKSVV